MLDDRFGLDKSNPYLVNYRRELALKLKSKDSKDEEEKPNED
ncbi:MAG TPA: hypothetical protein PKX91_01685 [Clostridia bacterium]|jgi:hypothetical protein|nr:hypothetical protein [Clostridia bacterium]